MCLGKARGQMSMFCIICYNNLPTNHFCNRVVSFATGNRVAAISLNALKGCTKSCCLILILFSVEFDVCSRQCAAEMLKKSEPFYQDRKQTNCIASKDEFLKPHI